MAKKNQSTGNFGVGTSWTPTVVNPAVQEWANKENTDWRLTPAARSKVVGGATKSTAVNRRPESSEEYTKRRVKEETKRTWRSDVADTLHGIGEGVLALHPYTAIPYYGAKVGQDFLNGTYGLQTALNASVPLFHLSPQIGAGIQATNNAVNTVSKYANPAFQVTKDVAMYSKHPLNWRNYKFLGDSRFYSDINNFGIKNIMEERAAENYPLTFAERRQWVTDFKNDVQEGIDYARQEAINNLKAPLKRNLPTITITTRNGIQIPSVNETPLQVSDIQLQPTHYGTALASRVYGDTPWGGGYGAFQNGVSGLYFPFRNRPRTLLTHTSFNDAPSRRLLGAHETRHTYQDYFRQPLVELDGTGPGSYHRYTHSTLPEELKDPVDQYISNSKTLGNWEGSLAEMDAELTGWGAKYGLPRYADMNPYQKAVINDLFQKRFGTSYNDFDAIYYLMNNSQNYLPELTNQYTTQLDNSLVGKIIQELEKAGYRKQGGKLIKRIK